MFIHLIHLAAQFAIFAYNSKIAPLNIVIFILFMGWRKLVEIENSRPAEPVYEEEVISGDISLCTSKETGNKVIIPFKDRFLHMLILGPTGSGKTSQILLPMIEQDLRSREAGITVIEPKGDLAEKVYAMAKYHKRKVVYFNPTHKDCPYFNPLFGPEDEVIENMATTFKMLNPDSPQYFKDMNETLIRNALKLLKRTKGNEATMLDLNVLLHDSNGQGKRWVNSFARVSTKAVEEAKENAEIASWFISEYFNPKSKISEHCSGLRAQIHKITSNPSLRRVLNPPNGENDVDFSDYLENGKVLVISTAQGELRDLGRFLGYFIILNLQSAVFRRPGNENTRRPHFLYIDEFQSYSNPGFADMLTQGRSYRVASHLATQNRALMAMGGGRDGNNFVELVSTNARNVVLFPGGNSKDAEYYSKEFGEREVVNETITEKVEQDTWGRDMVMNGTNHSYSKKKEARFSATALIYKGFGEVTYRIIRNNSVTAPGNGVVSWLPKLYNEKLDRIVAEYNERNTKIIETEDTDDEFMRRGNMEDEASVNEDKTESQSFVDLASMDLLAMQESMTKSKKSEKESDNS